MPAMRYAPNFNCLPPT